MGSPSFYRIAWSFYLVLALVAAVWIGWRTGAPVGLHTLVQRPVVQPQAVGTDVLLGIGAAGLLLGGWAGARRLVPSAADLERELGGLLAGIPRPERVGLALMSGFGEELFFRGALQGAIGWPLATLIFALLHTGSSRAYRLWTLFAAVAGLLFAGLTLWRSSLIPAIVAHVLVNGIQLQRLESTGEDGAGP